MAVPSPIFYCRAVYLIRFLPSFFFAFCWLINYKMQTVENNILNYVKTSQYVFGAIKKS